MEPFTCGKKELDSLQVWQIGSRRTRTSPRLSLHANSNYTRSRNRARSVASQLNANSWFVTSASSPELHESCWTRSEPEHSNSNDFKVLICNRPRNHATAKKPMIMVEKTFRTAAPSYFGVYAVFVIHSTLLVKTAKC